jgi:hypothetical protein
MNRHCMLRSAGLLLLAGGASAAFVNAFVPAFRGAPLAEFAGWENFVSEVGGSNPPDYPTTTTGSFDLVQTGEGAFNGGDFIYGLVNPLVFDLTHGAAPAMANPDVQEVVLQLRTLGNDLDTDVSLTYVDDTGTPQVVPADSYTELYNQDLGGGIGSEVEHLFTWNLASVGAIIPDYALHFESFFAHTGLDTVELDAQWASRAEVYCTAGVSASGCQASIGAMGNPSASAASGFFLTAANVEGDKDGLFFFGTNGRQANPWGNGTSFQCVVPPVKRAGVLNGSGTEDACDGTFQQDLNALWCSSCSQPGKNPGSGARVQAQLWYRDPANTSNQTTSLSNAIEFTVAP